MLLGCNDNTVYSDRQNIVNTDHMGSYHRYKIVWLQAGVDLVKTGL